MIGIIGAMEIETEGLKQLLKDKKDKRVESFLFSSGTIEGKEVVICCCGIGKVASAVATAIMLLNYTEIDLVVNIGVAGGIYPSIRQGDVVISSGTAQHDFETWEGPKGRVDSFDDVILPCDSIAIEKLESIIKRLDYKFYTAVIASGDQFICDKTKARLIYELFNAYACDMESSAINHTCILMNKRFVALRSISDNGNNSAVGDFFSFVETASKRSIEIVKNLIQAL